MNDTIKRAKALVESTLSARRASHVLAVAEEMERLSALFLPEQRDALVLSAFLHDVTKEKDTAAQLQLCDEYGIIPSADDLLVPKGLHALTGAEAAKREFDLADVYCDAIRYHTLGRAGMTVQDKLLYLADYIEHTRTYPACVALRRIFWERVQACGSTEQRHAVLDHAVRLGLDMTVRDLLEDEAFLHPDTVSARNDLLRREKARENRLKQERQPL